MFEPADRREHVSVDEPRPASGCQRDQAQPEEDDRLHTLLCGIDALGGKVGEAKRIRHALLLKHENLARQLGLESPDRFLALVRSALGVYHELLDETMRRRAAFAQIFEDFAMCRLDEGVI